MSVTANVRVFTILREYDSRTNIVFAYAGLAHNETGLDSPVTRVVHVFPEYAHCCSVVPEICHTPPAGSNPYEPVGYMPEPDDPHG